MFLLHPPTTALPISFLVLLLCTELFYFFHRAEWLQKTRLFLVIALAIGTTLAFLTGYQASALAGDLKEEPTALLARHHLLGRFLLITTITMAIFESIRPFATRGAVLFKFCYYSLLLLSTLMVFSIGFLGGVLVFTHGVGVDLPLGK